MAAGEVLKLGFHCLGLLKQRWTPSQFYTKHCLLSPQRSLSRDLSLKAYFPPSRARALPVGESACSELTGVFPVLPPVVGIAKVAEELPSTFPKPTLREGTGNREGVVCHSPVRRGGGGPQPSWGGSPLPGVLHHCHYPHGGLSP